MVGFNLQGLSACRRIKRQWYLEFTCDIRKGYFLALSRTVSTRTNHTEPNICMELNRQILSLFYIFRMLTEKTIKHFRFITVSGTRMGLLFMTKLART